MTKHCAILSLHGRALTACRVAVYLERHAPWRHPRSSERGLAHELAMIAALALAAFSWSLARDPADGVALVPRVIALLSPFLSYALGDTRRVGPVLGWAWLVPLVVVALEWAARLR
jgi:hypothetical protein